MLILNKFPQFTAVLCKYPFISHGKLSYAIQMSNKRPDPTLWGVYVYVQLHLRGAAHTIHHNLCCTRSTTWDYRKGWQQVEESIPITKMQLALDNQNRTFFMDFLQQSICRADFLNLKDICYTYSVHFASNLSSKQITPKSQILEMTAISAITT